MKYKKREIAMNKIDDFFGKLFNIIPGYIFGFLTFIIGLIGDIIALLLSPDYIMWKKSISILGHHPGGIYLRGGLIISSIFSILFIIYLGGALKQETVNDKVRKLAIITGIFSSAAAIFTAIFSGVNELISNLHGLGALLSWIGGAIFCSLFSIVMMQSTNFSKQAAYVGFIIAGIFLTYLIPFFITNFCNFYVDICYSFGRKVYLIMPMYEWIVIFSILFWHLFFAIYILYKKI